MMADDIADVVAHKEHRSLSGEREYEAAIIDVIGRAERFVRIFDRDLSSGGFGGVACSDALRGFLAKSRSARLLLVLHETSYLTARCPRLMSLLKTHGHAICVQQTSEQAATVSDPFVLADDMHYVHRFHSDGMRFLLALNDPLGARELQGRFDQLLEMSSPAVFATTTGL